MVPVTLRRKGFLILLATTVTSTLLIIFFERSNDAVTLVPTLRWASAVIDAEYTDQGWRGLSDEEIRNMSVLGRMLFLGQKPPWIHVKPEKNYQILVWKYGSTIENRHLKHWTNKFYDPFTNCSVNNCEITYEDDAVNTADIIIFHLHRMKATDQLPPRGIRGQEQIWAFLTDESPYHTFLDGKNKLRNYNGLFNWSMTYRMDSDIPVPYGRTILRKTKPRDKFTVKKRRDVLVAAMGSNCGGKNKRWDYLKELNKYIRVDFYGACGTLKCPGHFQKDCPLLDDYMFFLAFENTNCNEYLTEKIWWNAYAKNSIPVVMGPSRSNLRKLLPPSSYLNVEDYAQPVDLAKHLLYLNSTGKFLEFYIWKTKFEVLNEHGYFQSNSYHFCRICEALNYNERNGKSYENLERFWNVTSDCAREMH